MSEDFRSTCSTLLGHMSVACLGAEVTFSILSLPRPAAFAFSSFRVAEQQHYAWE